jgi:tRNA threonylcarbamoyladenosine biosynthesis protein TsaE
LTLHTSSADETIRLGERIGDLLRKGDVIALNGTLAAGKTTITKGIALGLGVEETVTSPTFTIVSEYSGRVPLYHIDTYRLDSCDSFTDIGGEDMLYGDGVCVVEWSEKIAGLLPEHTITIWIEMENAETRKFSICGWPYGDISDEDTCD